MKSVSVVRHAVTNLFENNAYQLFSTPLNERGQEQAERVAERFRGKNVDALVSSTMLRALQTAEYIAKVTRLEIVQSNFFHEVLRPTEVQGKRHDDPSIRHIRNYVHRNFHDPLVPKYSDEEKFHDLRERAWRGKIFLENMRGKNIVCVSHGGFMRMLFAVIFRGKDVSHDEYMRVFNFLVVKNAGVFALEYDWKGNGRWQLASDVSHL